MHQPDLEKIKRKQAELQAAHRAWIAEKAKHEILAFADEKGNVVLHHPDGHTELVHEAEAG